MEVLLIAACYSRICTCTCTVSTYTRYYYYYYAVLTSLAHLSLAHSLHRSETDSLQVTDRPYRFFCVCDQERREAYLLEVSTQGRPLATCLRSRGCYVVYHMATRKVYLWVGSKVTDGLRRSASRAARQLRKRSECNLNPCKFYEIVTCTCIYVHVHV